MLIKIESFPFHMCYAVAQTQTGLILCTLTLDDQKWYQMIGQMIRVPNFHIHQVTKLPGPTLDYTNVPRGTRSRPFSINLAITCFMSTHIFFLLKLFNTQGNATQTTSWRIGLPYLFVRWIFLIETIYFDIQKAKYEESFTLLLFWQAWLKRNCYKL